MVLSDPSAIPYSKEIILRMEFLAFALSQIFMADVQTIEFIRSGIVVRIWLTVLIEKFLDDELSVFARFSFDTLNDAGDE